MGEEASDHSDQDRLHRQSDIWAGAKRASGVLTSTISILKGKNKAAGNARTQCQGT